MTKKKRKLLADAKAKRKVRVKLNKRFIISWFRISMHPQAAFSGEGAVVYTRVDTLEEFLASMIVEWPCFSQMYTCGCMS